MSEINPAAVPLGGEVIVVEGLSNREFLEQYAAPGRVGLSVGMTLVDRMIVRAQRHLDDAHQWSSWSHAFLFQGRRADGRHWVIESDLQLHRKHIQLGVQENRTEKYFNEEHYTTLAVIDFKLEEHQVSALMHEALELAATRTRYSLRELIGTYLAMRHPGLRPRENLLARDRSFFCSAFVHHLFRKANLDLTPGVDVKHTTPEDIARTALPHTAWLLRREVPRSRVAKVAKKIRGRVRARVRRAKRKWNG